MLTFVQNAIHFLFCLGHVLLELVLLEFGGGLKHVIPSLVTFLVSFALGVKLALQYSLALVDWSFSTIDIICLCDFRLGGWPHIHRHMLEFPLFSAQEEIMNIDLMDVWLGERVYFWLFFLFVSFNLLWQVVFSVTHFILKFKQKSLIRNKRSEPGLASRAPSSPSNRSILPLKLLQVDLFSALS